MSEAPIDIDALMRLISTIGGVFEDFEELREDYARVAPELVASLRKASSDTDWNAMRIAAHTLKSNALDFGAIRLSQLCHHLERQCGEGNVPNADQAVADIEKEEELSRIALLKLVAADVAGD